MLQVIHRLERKSWYRQKIKGQCSKKLNITSHLPLKYVHLTMNTIKGYSNALSNTQITKEELAYTEYYRTLLKKLNVVLQNYILPLCSILYLCCYIYGSYFIQPDSGSSAYHLPGVFF